MHRGVHVALVAEEDAGDGPAVGQQHLRVQVHLPLFHRVERVRPRHVEHEEGSDGVLVVNSGIGVVDDELIIDAPTAGFLQLVEFSKCKEATLINGEKPPLENVLMLLLPPQE